MSGRPRNFDEADTLNRVMNSFWRNGYNATTFEQLVEDSGLSRSSLYNAFGGKDELFEVALDRFLEVQTGKFIQKLEADDGDELVLRVIQSFRQPYDGRSKGCLLQKTVLENAAEPSNPKLVSKITNYFTNIWKAFEKAIPGVHSRKKKKDLSDAEKAALLVAIMFGVSVIARNGKNEELANTITDATEKLIKT